MYSIFKNLSNKDIEFVIFNWLEIDDLKQLSKVNKYYNSLIKQKINNFYHFYNNYFIRKKNKELYMKDLYRDKEIPINRYLKIYIKYDDIDIFLYKYGNDIIGLFDSVIYITSKQQNSVKIMKYCLDYVIKSNVILAARKFTSNIDCIGKIKNIEILKICIEFINTYFHKYENILYRMLWEAIEVDNFMNIKYIVEFSIKNNLTIHLEEPHYSNDLYYEDLSIESLEYILNNTKIISNDELIRLVNASYQYDQLEKFIYLKKYYDISDENTFINVCDNNSIRVFKYLLNNQKFVNIDESFIEKILFKICGDINMLKYFINYININYPKFKYIYKKKEYIKFVYNKNLYNITDYLLNIPDLTKEDLKEKIKLCLKCTSEYNIEGRLYLEDFAKKKNIQL